MSSGDSPCVRTFVRGKILVVDDSQIARFSLLHPLQEAGFLVIEANSGLDALAKYKDNLDLSLAILDFSMPEMNGLELVRKLRSLQSAIRVIFVSAQTCSPHREELKSLGVIGWALKPLAPASLLALVNRVLESEHVFKK